MALNGPLKKLCKMHYWGECHDIQKKNVKDFMENMFNRIS